MRIRKKDRLPGGAAVENLIFHSFSQFICNEFLVSHGTAFKMVVNMLPVLRFAQKIQGTCEFIQQLKFTSFACLYNNKHYDIRWRKERREKVLKVDLPDFQELVRDMNMTPDEMRSKLKKDGKLPPRSFQERPIVISSTSAVFEPYIPPEGDGKSSTLTSRGMKQRLTELEKKGKSFRELRKIKPYEEEGEMDTKQFAQDALNKYIEAHKLLQSYKDNEDQLHELVTEKAYADMIAGLDFKTLRWNFVESIDSPRIVHVRTTSMISKDNLYGQITVRFHSKQTLALYDRFGRLMYGSGKLIKDVLEYVVFEKHLSDLYGLWRIHNKIIPDWLPPRDPIYRTWRKKDELPVEEDLIQPQDLGKDKEVLPSLAAA